MHRRCTGAKPEGREKRPNLRGARRCGHSKPRLVVGRAGGEKALGISAEPEVVEEEESDGCEICRMDNIQLVSLDANLMVRCFFCRDFVLR